MGLLQREGGLLQYVVGLLQWVVGLLQQVVGLLQHFVGDPLEFFYSLPVITYPLGMVLHANSEMAGDLVFCYLSFKDAGKKQAVGAE